MTLTDLRPDTTYTVRVQAVNRVGAGAFSPALRLATRPLPPAPPRLECASAAHNTLKLKWADGEFLKNLCVIYIFRRQSKNIFVVKVTVLGVFKMNVTAL